MIYFIVNPASKTGLGIKIWHDVRRYLDEFGTEYRFYLTEEDKNGTAIASQLLNKFFYDKLRIVVLGGDGTINEVLQAFSEKDFERVTLGYIPTGSSNDLARALGYQDFYNNPEEILKQLITSNAYRMMDLGLLTYNQSERPGYTKRYFIVSCGIGFDASVCEEALNSKSKSFLNRFHMGKLSYGAISLKQLLGARRISCKLTLDDQKPLQLNNCYFVTVMNHCYQGGGIKFCPDAIDDDGLLDVCYASEISRGRVLYTLPYAFKGNHCDKKGVGISKAKKIRIQYDEPLWVHTDGEVKTKSTDVSVIVLPKRLKFII